MSPLLFILAQIVITGPPTGETRPPDAKYIFSREDYPAEAVSNRWEGAVAVDVLVDRSGSPKACSIIKSSGHKVLDDATCALIMTRAKFVPDKDKAGNPIESHYRPPSVQWRLKR